jgi:hypothetical protein
MRKNPLLLLPVLVAIAAFEPATLTKEAARAREESDPVQDRKRRRSVVAGWSLPGARDARRGRTGLVTRDREQARRVRQMQRAQLKAA